MNDIRQDNHLLGAIFTILASVLLVGVASVVALQLLFDWHRPGYDAAFAWRHALAAFVALFGVLIGAEYAHRRTASREAAAFYRLLKKERDERSEDLLLSNIARAVALEAILSWIAEVTAGFLDNADALAIFGDAKDQYIIGALWRDDAAEQLCKLDMTFITNAVAKAPEHELDVTYKVINFLNILNYFRARHASRLGTPSMDSIGVERDLKIVAGATARAHKAVREFRERGRNSLSHLV